MKLKHKILRSVIYSGVVVLTSSFLIYELLTSHRAMTGYMHYIVEKAESVFLDNKYKNQLVAAKMARGFDMTADPESMRAACKSMQREGRVYGLNITSHAYTPLHGALYTLQEDCQSWQRNIPALFNFDRAVSENNDSAVTSLRENKKPLQYYIDLEQHYVYLYNRKALSESELDNWSFLQSGGLGLSVNARKTLFEGGSAFSSIYSDALTGDPVMSLLTPVFERDRMKGVVMVDFQRHNLENIFYTADRPQVWRYLDIVLSDSDSSATLTVHQRESRLYEYVRYQWTLAGDMKITLSLDIIYFILSSWKLFLVYLLSTVILLHLVRMHFRIHYDVSKENISDAMTGLFNRKIFSSVLQSRLQRLVDDGVSVVFMAIDCDRLKYINDTFGHKEGDLAIVNLAKAIQAAIRKTDYAVRLGGDEFCIVLIDYDEKRVERIPQRIRDALVILDPEKRVNFSWGVHKMAANDTIDDAYKASDAQLYLNKNAKK